MVDMLEGGNTLVRRDGDIRRESTFAQERVSDDFMDSWAELWVRREDTRYELLGLG